MKSDGEVSALGHNVVQGDDVIIDDHVPTHSGCPIFAV